MTISEFMACRDADIRDAVQAVESTAGLRPDDVLLGVGSVVEGLGNSKSDLDLVLITRRDDACLPREIAVVVGRCLSDVQIVPASEVEHLIARLNLWSAQPWDVAHSCGFSLEERRLLHRLLNCTVLFEGPSSRLTFLLPERRQIARLKLQLARYMARTIQIDMAGNREDDDYATLVLAAQELLGHAIDALLAGYHLTNPTPKWRTRLLKMLPADWENNIRLRPSGCDAAQFFWQLHQIPQRPDRGPALAYALRITTFARSVFVWAERKLVDPLVSHSRPLCWYSNDGRFDRRCLPYLDLDVDFFEDDEGAALGRLNEFGDPVEVSATELEVALLFDGVTSPTEAAYAVYGPGAAESEERAVNVVISRLQNAGLVVPAPPVEGRVAVM